MNIIKEDKRHMKYLKIENNKGYYLNQNKTVWVEIDKISKEDLLFLLNEAITNEFEIDEFIEGNIGHKAHQIVYKSIHEKFLDLLENKKSFIDECDLQFRSSIEKYEVNKEE